MSAAWRLQSRADAPVRIASRRSHLSICRVEETRLSVARIPLAEELRSGARDTHRHRVRVRLHWGEQGSAARAGLHLLIADVTV